jgi:hypothetical protein
MTEGGRFGYCERTLPGLLAEPLNAFSNLGFLLAAFCMWRAIRHAGHRPLTAPDLFALPVLAGLIGIGSLAWHTLATPWAALADVLPIQAFISVFLVSSLVRLLGVGLAAALAGLVAFQGVGLALPQILPPAAWNGSVMYAPAWLALAAITIALRGLGSPVPARLGAALLLFTLALALRTADRALCPIWPYGTHFLWHLCNAGVLHLLGTALAGAGERRSRRFPRGP